MSLNCISLTEVNVKHKVTRIQTILFACIYVYMYIYIYISCLGNVAGVICTKATQRINGAQDQFQYIEISFFYCSSCFSSSFLYLICYALYGCVSQQPRRKDDSHCASYSMPFHLFISISIYFIYRYHINANAFAASLYQVFLMLSLVHTSLWQSFGVVFQRCLRIMLLLTLLMLMYFRKSDSF